VPASALLADGLAEPTIAVYQDAERIMMERVARRLAAGLASPSWAEEKLAEISALRAEVQSLLTTTTTDAEAAVQDGIAKAYRLGTGAANADLAAGGAAAGAATNTNTVGVMVAETMGRLSSTNLRVLRTAEDVYRSTIAQTAAQVVAGTMTARESVQAAMTKFADEGVTGFVDTAGKNWDLTSYAQMATRTAVGRAAIAGHLESLLANGHELVVVSSDQRPCPVCEPWEGEVLVIRGDSNEYPGIEEAEGAGLMHPGCAHSYEAYFEGVTPTKATDPELYPTEKEADEAYGDRQRLRYLERQVRSSKLREATAVTPQAATAARARVAGYQGEIRDHISATGLLRQRHREQI